MCAADNVIIYDTIYHIYNLCFIYIIKVRLERVYIYIYIYCVINIFLNVETFHVLYLYITTD